MFVGSYHRQNMEVFTSMENIMEYPTCVFMKVSEVSLCLICSKTQLVDDCNFKAYQVEDPTYLTKKPVN